MVHTPEGCREHSSTNRRVADRRSMINTPWLSNFLPQCQTVNEIEMKTFTATYLEGKSSERSLSHLFSSFFSHSICHILLVCRSKCHIPRGSLWWQRLWSAILAVNKRLPGVAQSREDFPNVHLWMREWYHFYALSFLRSVSDWASWKEHKIPS